MSCALNALTPWCGPEQSLCGETGATEEPCLCWSLALVLLQGQLRLSQACPAPLCPLRVYALWQSGTSEPTAGAKTRQEQPTCSVRPTPPSHLPPGPLASWVPGHSPVMLPGLGQLLDLCKVTDENGEGAATGADGDIGLASEGPDKGCGSMGLRPTGPR